MLNYKNKLLVTKADVESSIDIMTYNFMHTVRINLLLLKLKLKALILLMQTLRILPHWLLHLFQNDPKSKHNPTELKHYAVKASRSAYIPTISTVEMVCINPNQRIFPISKI